jgi:hypothetical protein
MLAEPAYSGSRRAWSHSRRDRLTPEALLELPPRHDAVLPSAERRHPPVDVQNVDRGAPRRVRSTFCITSLRNVDGVARTGGVSTFCMPGVRRIRVSRRARRAGWLRAPTQVFRSCSRPV